MNVTNFPLVTIGIPTYNQKWCIDDAIKSAAAQDYPNLEIIIADDSSTENIYEVIKSYEHDKRIKYYRNDLNLGRTGNYKKCLYDYASGDWYLNLDGDDKLVDNSFISNAIKYIELNPNIVLATAACRRIINNQVDYTIISHYDKDVSILNGEDFFLDLATQKAWISHLTSLYNRKKALTLNFYREDILSSDYESLYRLVLTGDVLVFSSVAGDWRIHDDNESKKVIDEPSLIINNFKYIESVAEFAKSYLSTGQVKKWKSRVLNDQVLAVALKFLLYKPLKYFHFTLPMLLRYPLIIIYTQFRILGRGIKKLIKNI